MNDPLGSGTVLTKITPKRDAATKAGEQSATYCTTGMAVQLTLKFTNGPLAPVAVIADVVVSLASTNEPVFPRKTFPVLWMVITGTSIASGLVELAVASGALAADAGTGPPSASANANAMAMTTM